MKKKIRLFPIACLVICLVPSVGMLFFPTTESTENKAMAEAPELITEDGAINTAFFDGIETYFDEHMALRNELIFVDAKIQSAVFRQSNVDGVIYGTDGWLYYTSTLNDYLGTDIMSKRELNNLAHNFNIVQEYLENRGISFVLTVPPNKNTLYGENMPYYDSYTVSNEHNAKLLKPLLTERKVNYLDLFEMFEEQDEVLYLKRDSHWNMKGACMAYNAIMDKLSVKHEDYSSVTPTVENTENGDLNKMLYSFYGDTEENYSYGNGQEYSYENEVESVEDGWIITQNETGNGTLLMFRDSFANTLIPFMSNEFETAYYSKGMPNALERYADIYSPDYVVIEKVERNIGEYLLDPPIISAPETELPDNVSTVKTGTTATIKTCENDVDYYMISGEIAEEQLDDNSEILVAVDNTVYKAYQTEENEYRIYINKDLITSSSAYVRVYVLNGNSCKQVFYLKLNVM